MNTDLFVPPSAEGLPVAALDSATEGADRLDAFARTPQGRNLLAHALVQLARDGWLRAEAGEGFEPMRDRETPLPAAGCVVSAAPTQADDGLRDRIADTLAAADGWKWTPDFDKSLSPSYRGYQKRADAVLVVLRGCTLRELEQLYRPNTPPSRPQPPADRGAVPCSCRDNPAFTAEIGYPVRCPHCPPGADAIPPTHWTQHVQRHHPELRRMADEAREVECANCWRLIENRSAPNMGGPSHDHWVHVPGGFTVCFPQRGGDSPRAEPRTTAARARQDEAHRG